MIGVSQPEYTHARRVLLGAFEAHESHLSSFVLVGAQAISIPAGESDIAVAPYTTDADVVVSPQLVTETPLIEIPLLHEGSR